MGSVDAMKSSFIAEMAKHVVALVIVCLPLGPNVVGVRLNHFGPSRFARL